jgi:signal transduction histidine kinase
LDISKIEANAMELRPDDFELVNLLSGIAVMFDGRCEEKKLDFAFINHCPPTADSTQDDPLIAVHGDQGKLRQIVINLLGNAVKFTQSGAVSLALSVSEPDHYLFEVRDTGIGIDPEDIKEVFATFGQTSAGAAAGGTGLGPAIAHKQVRLMGGTGLGLAIAHKQVRLMGGDLELESVIGQGCRFFFTLPLPAAKAEIEARINRNYQAVKLAPGVSVNALVVDDVEENRNVLRHK